MHMTPDFHDWLSVTDRTQIRHVQGLAGAIELLVDAPSVTPLQGVVLIGHPQPLLGGTAQHKVPQLLARAARELGWLAVRPNFRGVGASAGQHDQGIGETLDLVGLAQALRAAFPDLPLGLAGFSFGAYVQSRVAQRLADAGDPPAFVLLAGMPAGAVEGGRYYDTGPAVPRTLVVHGELDERVPLSSVLDWARPQSHPVTVVPGADHFFTGRLQVLRDLLRAHVAAAPWRGRDAGA